MKKTLAAIAVAAAAALSLAACESMGGPGPHSYGYVDGYYDDAYGPFYDGYWGADDVFYYRTGEGGDYIRDNDHHMRHDNAAGFHTFHSRAGRAPEAKRE
jgi:hypothetical protein